MRSLLALVLFFFATTFAQAGAWGEGAFDNDDALDWVAQCIRSKDITPVSRALQVVLGAEYIEAPEGSVAVAAAEVVAASLGKPNAKLPPELQSWVRRQPTGALERLAPLARQAVERIQDPKTSELRQLWSEGKANNWRSGVTNLETRLAN